MAITAYGIVRGGIKSKWHDWHGEPKLPEYSIYRIKLIEKPVRPVWRLEEQMHNLDVHYTPNNWSFGNVYMIVSKAVRELTPFLGASDIVQPGWKEYPYTKKIIHHPILVEWQMDELFPECKDMTSEMKLEYVLDRLE